jgi:hypothetical protein
LIYISSPCCSPQCGWCPENRLWSSSGRANRGLSIHDDVQS